MEVIRTDRLILRELEASDLDTIALLLGDPVVMAHWPRPYTREEAAEWIQRQRERYERDGIGYWLLCLAETHEPVGQAGLLKHRIGDREEVGLGYILALEHWGEGLAREAALACLRFGFDQLGLPRIVCLLRPENERSALLARRLGLCRESRVEYAGFLHDVYVAESCSWRSGVAGEDG